MSERIEELQNTLPMPLAQLVRRMAAASTARDRHDGAFYLAEATLKLASAARVGRLLSLGTPPGAALSRKLEGLLLPSTGHWAGLLRSTTDELAAQPEGANDPLAVRSALTGPRKELTAFAAFAKAMEAEHLANAQSAVQAVKKGVFGFFDLLVAYRNRVIGHSGQRLPAFYAEMGDLLIAALDQILRVPELFGGCDLVVPRLETVDGTSASTRLRVLRGLATAMRPADGEGWKPGELYLVGSAGYRAPLAPLVVFAESREQHEQFGFLNGVDARDKDVIKRVEYLDYATSAQLTGVDTIPQLASLLARIRGAKVDTADVRATMTELALHQAEAPKDDSAPPTAASLAVAFVGTVVVGKYRVLREIGQGGMGAVYEVEHTSIHSRWAMKVLHIRLAAKDEYIQRFAREAREAAQTKHPGIVQITDHGRLDDGSAYLIMELLDGESLQQRIDRAPLSIDETVAVGISALDAFEAAHQRGVVHRDIKPDNLFLPSSKDGPKVKILDFGIAKSSDEAEKLTADGAILGTPSYIAPEQLGNSRTVTARADIYAMGATLFACLTGRAPVDGSDLRSLLFNVSQGAIERDPRKLRTDTPDWLAAIIQRALLLSPAARFESAAAMRDALKSHASESVVATAFGKTIPGEPADPPGVPPAPPAKPQPRQARSSARWPIIGAAASCIALGGWLYTRGGEPTPDARPSGSAPHVATSAPVAISSARGSATETTETSAKTSPAPGPARSMVAVKGASFLLGITKEELAQASTKCKAGARCKELMEPLSRALSPVEVTVSPFRIDRTEVSVGTFATWLNELHGASEIEIDRVTGGVSKGKIPVARIAGSDGQLAYAELPLTFDAATGFAVASGKVDMPMAMVTWFGAQLYCTSVGARLPTEAEWELAARGPSREPYSWGSIDLDATQCGRLAFGRVKDKKRWDALAPGPCTDRPDAYDPVSATDVTHEARGTPIFGLAGNVREWVLDVAEENPRGHAGCEATPCKDPWRASESSPLLVNAARRSTVARLGEWTESNVSAATHVTRGCSFIDEAPRCHAAARGLLDGREADVRVGFRCAIEDEQ